MDTHTPGPWTSGTSNHRKAIFAPDSRGAIPIAYVGNNGQAHEVEIANARLIAAAPELLAALEGLFTHYIGDRSSANVAGPAGVAIDGARAAIKNAEGK